MRMRTMTIKNALEILEQNYAVALHDYDNENNTYQSEQVAALGVAIDILKRELYKQQERLESEVTE